VVRCQAGALGGGAQDVRARAMVLRMVSSGCTLAAELPELGRLGRRQIAAFVGLAPYPRDSGVLRRTRTIWGGRAVVRTALYLAATSGVRCNPTLRTFDQRLVAAEKPRKAALTATAHTLLTSLNGTVTFAPITRSLAVGGGPGTRTPRR